MGNRSVFSKSSAVLAVLVILGTIGIPTTHAGSKISQEVVIYEYRNGTAGGAYGSIGSARNSNDGDQMIGCSLWAYKGEITRVICSAIDRNRNYVSCSSSDWRLIQAVTAMTSNSYISFGWKNYSDCWRIQIGNTSTSEVAR